MEELRLETILTIVHQIQQEQWVLAGKLDALYVQSTRMEGKIDKILLAVEPGPAVAFQLSFSVP